MLNFGRFSATKLIDPYSFQHSSIFGSKYIKEKLEDIAKTRGITEKEALKQLLEDNLETMRKAEAKFRKLEERFKRKYEETGK